MCIEHAARLASGNPWQALAQVYLHILTEAFFFFSSLITTTRWFREREALRCSVLYVHHPRSRVIYENSTQNIFAAANWLENKTLKAIFKRNPSAQVSENATTCR